MLIVLVHMEVFLPHGNIQLTMTPLQYRAWIQEQQ